MIRQPAAAAGLVFDSDPVRRVRLDATLAAEAAKEPGALPLLSFLLEELYKKDVEKAGLATLTYNSMRELGGLKGAITRYAEDFVKKLPANLAAELPSVLLALCRRWMRPS